jgi:S1-C subfamily serine protease
VANIDITDPFGAVHQDDSPPPPPPPPDPPMPPDPPAPQAPRSGHSGRLTALLVVIALAVGVVGGRFVAPRATSSNQTTSQPFNTPATTPNSLPSNNGNSNNGDGTGSSNNGSSNSSGNGSANTAAAKVAPAVVNINTVLASGRAAGTGMIITSDGEALTNNHVIDGATQISVELADGSTHSAAVLGYDVTDDVALIKIQGVSGLPTISTADSTSLSVGTAVVALGNALGQGGAPSVVTGAVTKLHQTITASGPGGENPETLQDLIQTDAPIQAGDSGGPLANTDGKVVGMDAAASTNRGFGFQQSTGGSQGFAIPIEDALAIAHHIEGGDESATVHIGSRGIMGVALQPQDTGNGAIVADTQAGSPAADAGISAGDTIVAIDGTSIGSAAELQSAMNSHHGGDRVKVTWVDSSGARHTKTLKLISGPPD